MSDLAGIVVGLGASSGVTAAAFAEALSRLDREWPTGPVVVRAVATIDRVARSAELRAAVREHSRDWVLAVTGGLPLLCYPAEELARVSVANPSDSVSARVGTPSVAEASCLRAAAELGDGPARLVVRKFVASGVTLAAAVATGTPGLPESTTSGRGVYLLRPYRSR
ncbi:cobalt-precorrin 5A hydrolase [Actinopolyspora xinjiangensis]|uniref:Cobalt-precorrin 5A hydrolase n=1 Tax=Actinopolyspora xinjiangensis TaxID=405564 RepID=A0A1H0SXG6_9ACTN|nr:cobalamin biosynthesis protein [Actinopolyspora xinjiangensis]SDP46240.1 cobalt-precorrin 5A hydrolase [Actinopolyspora xinjiangensis]